jgi:hypothetical protein
MKSIYTLCIVLSLMLLAKSGLFAQTTGDYQSRATGLWSASSTWSIYNGTSWVNASSAPTGSETVTLQGTDSVSVDATVTITGALISTGGKLGNSGETLVFASTGRYLHEINAGNIPEATWEEGSTIRVTGSASAGPSFPSDREYYNVEFDLHAMTANLQINMTGTSLTFNGNFWVGATVTAAGVLQQLRLSGSSATFPSYYRTYYIKGNIIMDSTRSILTTCGSSSANTGDSVYVGGNIIINAGEFSLNRGSGASAWFFCAGDFHIAAGARMTRHSSSTFPAMIFFAKTGQQSFTNNGTITTGYSTPIEMIVNSGSTFNAGTSSVTGGVNFTLKSGATLEMGKSGGVDSAIACENGSGTAVTKTFEAGSNFKFNGSVAQVTGSLMPASVNDLTIDNATGVALSNATTVIGKLYLTTGILDNCTNNVTVPAANIITGTGSLACTPDGVEPNDPTTIPQTFFVNQNYPNPFNPSTSITFGLDKDSYVTAKVFNLLGQEVVTLFAGNQNVGAHTLNFDASKLCSGVYYYRIQAGNEIQTKQMLLAK